MPPGLAPGPHYVRLRTVRSGFSEAFQILFGAAPEPAPTAALPPGAAPTLLEVENGMTQTAEFRGYRNEYLSCRFRLPAPDLDRGDVLIEVGGRDCAVDFVTNLGALWQTNSKLPPELPPGRYQVRVKLGNGQASSALEIVIAKG